MKFYVNLIKKVLHFGYKGSIILNWVLIIFNIINENILYNYIRKALK